MAKKKALIAATVLSVFVGGSAFAAGAADNSAKSGKLHFVAIAKSLNNSAFQIAENGAKDRIAELGDVEIEWTAPSSSDPGQMVQMIEGYVQKGVDGLLIDSLGPSVSTAIDMAAEAGIPVICWDSDAPESKRLAYVGCDNYQGGVEAGALYAEAAKGKGKQKIAILTGVPGAFNLQERDRGFVDGLKKNNVDFEIVTTVPGYDDLTKSVEAVESTLRGNAAINGFYFDGPWPLLVEESNLQLMIQKVKAGELTVVSFDTLQPCLPYCEKGYVYGLVGQKYYGWGYQGVTVLYEIVKHKAKYPPIIYTGIDIVTKNGGPGRLAAADVIKMWEAGKFNEKPIMPEDVK